MCVLVVGDTWWYILISLIANKLRPDFKVKFFVMMVTEMFIFVSLKHLSHLKNYSRKYKLVLTQFTVKAFKHEF